MKPSLKDTLNLPQTAFPMRADLVAREPQRFQAWEAQGLYQRIQAQNKDKPAFILHDGPPFTNGDVHIGTALNKILKDVIVRYKSMRGYRAPFIPGWDCHGLPIEHKVMQEQQQHADQVPLSPLAIRQACAAFSQSYIQKQSAQFKRLGVLADWDQAYRTMDPSYEAQLLHTLAHFVEKGLLYRSKKPVYWSIPCKTALAEAEIEYKEHRSTAAWVAFDLSPQLHQALQLTLPTACVIWTTTPWTLPANQAIALNPELSYVVLQHQGRGYLVAHSLAQHVAHSCQWQDWSYGPSITPQSLQGHWAQHPFLQRQSRFILADYVTAETGSGCVHTAPGHGLDDYASGLRHQLPVYSPIDDQGCYADDGQLPQALVGLPILPPHPKAKSANQGVLELLEASGSLLHQHSYVHSYPHCWRSKTPVIFRAMDQWFIRLDDEALRQKALALSARLQYTPQWGQRRLEAALQARPDWCISRQRTWGVPLPVLYDEAGQPLLSADFFRHVAQLVAQHGSDVWFASSAEALTQGFELPPQWQGKTLVKSQDTLDVWLDSGCSHRAVLHQHPELAWPADVYFEGSDQHRGWFQSSFWTALVADGALPYRHLITHGFVVGEDKRKISKSDGKPQTADDYVGRLGADIVRWWICSEDYRNDVPLSEGILDQMAQGYRCIRNTLRFLLGNLHDFDATQAVPTTQLLPLDQWALYETALLARNVTAAMDAFEFHKATQQLGYFCSVTLSATYHDSLKDRLYTTSPQGHARRSAQSVLHTVLHTLLGLLAPVLVFTADEAFGHTPQAAQQAQQSPGHAPSVHLQPWPVAIEGLCSDAQLQTTHAAVAELLSLKGPVNEALEAMRQAKTLGQSLDAQLHICLGAQHPLAGPLQQHAQHLAELFIVSAVHVELVDAQADARPQVRATKASGLRCPRSWRWVPQLAQHPHFGPVSPRCHQALVAKYPDLT